MGILLIGFILPLISIFFESYPRIINRKFGVDIWTHLLYLKEYHKQKGIPGVIDRGFLVPGEYDYPPAFISILAKFPFRLVEKYEFLFSPIFDCLHIILIFFISYFLTKNIILSVLTQSIYMLIPIITIENSSATPRSLGYMLFTIVYTITFVYIISGNVLFLILAIFFGSLIFLSHRFTAQGFLFFSIFFSLFERNIMYFVIFVCAFILSIILSKGFYIKVLKGHLGNLIFWQKEIKYRFFHQVKGNYKEYKTHDFVFAVYNQFLKFPPFVLFVTNPWIIALVYVGVYQHPTDPFLTRIFILSLFFYCVSLITIWIPQLQFLGEGQRYLELFAFPSALIAAETLQNLIKIGYGVVAIPLYVIIGSGAFATILVIQRKAIIKDTLRTLTPALQEMFAYLRNLKKKPRLLCIPHQITTNTIYHTECPVFVNATYKYIKKISDVYPFLKLPIKTIMEKHNLNMVLLNEEYAAIEDLKLKKYHIVKQVDNYVLLSIQ